MSLDTNGKSFFEKEREEQEKELQKGGRFGFSRRLSVVQGHRPGKRGHHLLLFLGTFLASVGVMSYLLSTYSDTITAQLFEQKETKIVPTPAVAGVAKEKISAFDHQLLATKLTNKDKDLVIVDIRPQEEYDNGHIVTSVNIPVSEGEMVQDGKLDVESVVEAFEELGYEKTIIIYAQNAYDELPTEIVRLLDTEGADAKPLAVGWEEWEHLHDK